MSGRLSAQTRKWGKGPKRAEGATLENFRCSKLSITFLKRVGQSTTKCTIPKQTVKAEGVVDGAVTKSKAHPALNCVRYPKMQRVANYVAKIVRREFGIIMMGQLNFSP